MRYVRHVLALALSGKSAHIEWIETIESLRTRPVAQRFSFGYAVGEQRSEELKS